MSRWQPTAVSILACALLGLSSVAAISQETGGYAVLAAFEEAEFLARSGDRQGAATAYDRIAAVSGLDPAFRVLAAMLPIQEYKQICAEWGRGEREIRVDNGFIMMCFTPTGHTDTRE